MNVGILVYPGAEILDFAGPFEVFSVATRVARRDRDPEAAPFEAFLIAEDAGIVAARHGFQVKPHYVFEEHPNVDLLVVPGGVIDQPRNSRRTLDWIERTADGADLITSVCTGAFLLAEIGRLTGLKATTHWEDIDDLRRQFSGVEAVDDQIVVDQGRVITSAGISAGIDMSLYLVGRLQGLGLAQRTARQMVYDWPRATSPVRACQSAGQ